MWVGNKCYLLYGQQLLYLTTFVRENIDALLFLDWSQNNFFSIPPNIGENIIKEQFFILIISLESHED